MAWIHDSPKEESEFESALEEAIKGDMVDLAVRLPVPFRLVPALGSGFLFFLFARILL